LGLTVSSSQYLKSAAEGFKAVAATVAPDYRQQPVQAAANQLFSIAFLLRGNDRLGKLVACTGWQPG
jgi:hypothetical protein